jgi:RNA polymerase sigma-70 factor (ECF subfamily)
MASWVLPGDAEDRAILDASRRADPSAFDLLYRNYGAAVSSLCRRLLHNRTAAEDACQETMIKAYQALPGFQRGRRIWPWLSTIARNVCIDMSRVEARSITVADVPEHGVAPSPDDLAARRARARLLRASLRRLEKRERMYVYLRDAWGWSYEQIAAFDGTTVPAVRSVLHRGRAALRDAVADTARERHEWPLPAFLPVVWWRIRARVGQLRDAVASWAVRLDPSAAVSAALGTVAVQTSVAVVMLGVLGAPSSGGDVRDAVTAAAQPPAAATPHPGTVPAATADGGGAAAAAPTAGAAQSVLGDRARVAVSTEVRQTRDDHGTYREAEPLKLSIDLDGNGRHDTEDLGAGAPVYISCADDPARRGVTEQVLCSVTDERD